MQDKLRSDIYSLFRSYTHGLDGRLVTEYSCWVPSEWLDDEAVTLGILTGCNYISKNDSIQIFYSAENHDRVREFIRFKLITGGRVIQNYETAR